MELSPSILAYSLLYPYTDNYIDDPRISGAAKRAFNERLGRRLAGERLSPAGVKEKAIFKLVAMVEEQYSRNDNPDVFESLLSIHDAQSESLHLLRENAAPGEVDVHGLSFYKGGILSWRMAIWQVVPSRNGSVNTPMVMASSPNYWTTWRTPSRMGRRDVSHFMPSPQSRSMRLPVALFISVIASCWAWIVSRSMSWSAL